MSEIKDWKGNVIKEGDEICVITTKIKDYFGKTAFYMPQKDGSYKQVVVKEKPELTKDVWVVGNYQTVYNCNGMLCTKHEVGGDIFYHSLYTSILFSDPDCYIIGIKGVSDTKE